MATTSTPRIPAEAQAAPWLIDTLLAVAVSLVLALLIATDTAGAPSPAAASYVLAAGVGALTMFRRKAPRTVLLLTTLAVCLYYVFDYPPIGMAIPLAAALYSAAEASRIWWALGTGIAMLAISTYFRLGEGDPLGFLLGYELVSNLAIIAAAVALGEAVRARRARRFQQEEMDRLTASEFEAETASRLQAERMGIARDLHDLIGHGMSVITVHSNVAAESIGRDDTAAAAAIEQIQAAGSQMMGELRSVVRVLRDPESTQRNAVHSLQGVDSLIETARAAGLRVTADICSGLEAPGTVQAAGYRIIQEALTNVMRHAPAGRAEVHVQHSDGALRIRVQDDGGTSVPQREQDRPASRKTAGSGSGIAGMRERVRLMGGTLHAGPVPNGGFAVEAVLPLSWGPAQPGQGEGARG